MKQIIIKFIKDIRPELTEDELEREARKLEAMLLSRWEEMVIEYTEKWKGDWKDKIVKK